MLEVRLYNVLPDFDRSLAGRLLWPCTKSDPTWFHRDNYFDKIGRISHSSNSERNIGLEGWAHVRIYDSCRRSLEDN